MIRVLHVINGMNSGGMETMIMNYYRKIDRTKVQFDFLILTPEKCFYEDEIVKLGGIIYRATSRKSNIIENRKEIKQFFKRHSYSIVEFHQGITYYYPLKIAKKYGVKVRIIHNHGIDRKYLKYLKIYNEIYAKNRISNLATNYFSCSEEVNDQLFSNRVIKENNIVIVENAIDVKKYKYDDENRIVIRNKLNIDSNTNVYGHIGTFTYPKNHKFLIEVFEGLVKKNSNSKLILIGKGPLQSDIKKLVNEKNLNDKVLFLGTRNDINKILSVMDCFIFPSLFEGIPLTLIEAQANGVSIVMSDNISKRVMINENCIQLSLDNKQEWIKTILEVKKDGIEKRIKRNDKIKQTNYNIELRAKQLQEIYLNYAKDNS